MAGWSSLPIDPLLVVTDMLLSTTDGVVSYLEMRAVCHDWRFSIPKPSLEFAVADPCFHPHDWIMLDQKKPADGVDSRFFLNLSTGRRLRIRLPLLDD